MEKKLRIIIFQGSPRRNGNTAELCKPFMEELTRRGAEVRYIFLGDKKINSCLGCYHCQNVQGEYGCVQKDDMTAEIAGEIIDADCIVLATPIYSWYCPSAMKALLDRHFGFNKYYGKAEGSLWAGKKVALLLTHGYDREYATTPFVTGIKSLCSHSDLDYVGMYSVRDVNDIGDFRTTEVKQEAARFAADIMERC